MRVLIQFLSIILAITILSCNPENMDTENRVNFQIDNSFDISNLEEISSAIDIIYDIKKIPTGYIIAGGGISDVVVATLTNDLSIQWIQTIGESDTETAFEIKETDDNGYILVGSSNNSQYKDDALVVKIGPLGDLIWKETYGGTFDDQAKDIVQVTHGYLFTGFTSNSFSNTSEVFVTKVDDFGSEVWSFNIDSSSLDYGYSILEIAENEYLISSASTDVENTEFIFTEINGNGQVLKTSTIDKASTLGLEIETNNIIQSEDGGFYLLTHSELNNSLFLTIYRLSDLYEIIWEKTFKSGTTNSGTNMLVDKNDDLVVIGHITNENDVDGLFLKLSKDGEVLTSSKFVTDKTDVFNDIIESENGEFIICTTIYNEAANSTNFHLIKTDSQGNLIN